MKKMREPEKKVVKDERTNERIKRPFYEEHKSKKGKKLKKNIEKKKYYEMRDEVRWSAHGTAHLLYMYHIAHSNNSYAYYSCM